MNQQCDDAIALKSQQSLPTPLWLLSLPFDVTKHFVLSALNLGCLSASGGSDISADLKSCAAPHSTKESALHNGDVDVDATAADESNDACTAPSQQRIDRKVRRQRISAPQHSPNMKNISSERQHLSPKKRSPTKPKSEQRVPLGDICLNMSSSDRHRVAGAPSPKRKTREEGEALESSSSVVDNVNVNVPTSTHATNLEGTWQQEQHDNELIELKLQIANQLEMIDTLTSKLSRVEIENWALREEKTKLTYELAAAHKVMDEIDRQGHKSSNNAPRRFSLLPFQHKPAVGGRSKKSTQQVSAKMCNNSSVQAKGEGNITPPSRRPLDDDSISERTWTIEEDEEEQRDDASYATVSTDGAREAKEAADNVSSEENGNRQEEKESPGTADEILIVDFGGVTPKRSGRAVRPVWASPVKLDKEQVSAILSRDDALHYFGM